MKQIANFLSNKFLQFSKLSKFFKKNEDGAVAVEFGFIGLPFFLLIFGILEVAMVFYAEINLNHATNETARKVRTLQAEIKTSGDFVQDVCNTIVFFPNCMSKLKVEVRVHDDFEAIDKTNPLNDDGDLSDNFIFNLGGPGSVITVRTFAEWDLFAKLPDFGLSNMSNGNRLVEGFAAFRNEPLGIAAATPSGT